MSLSRKYGQNGKTYHVPYSKGTDSTDRKNWDYWDNIIKGVAQGEQSWTTLNLESGQMERVESQAQSPIKNLIFT